MKQRISYNEKVSKILDPPYFKNMDLDFGISDTNDQVEILKFIYGNDIRITSKCIYDSKDNNIYYEHNHLIYFEDNDYSWIKYEYDIRGNHIYSEDSNGNWYRYEYNSSNQPIYYERSDGYCETRVYDNNGNRLS